MPLTPETVEFLADHSVPPDLRTFLKAHSYAEPITIGAMVFDCVNDIASENLDPLNARCVRHGLLIVGSGLNGDPIAVDLRANLAVGFMPHDELWENRRSAPRRLYVSSKLDLGTFYLAAALHRDSFPLDSYYAKELSRQQWEMLTKLRPSRARRYEETEVAEHSDPVIEAIETADRARLEPSLKNHKKALALLRRTAVKHASSPRAYTLHFALGKLLARMGDLVSAAAAFRQVYQGWPQSVLAPLARDKEAECLSGQA